MAETPNDVGGDGDGNGFLDVLDFGLRALNSLFGFGKGPRGTHPRDAAAKYGSDYFTKNRTPPAAPPSASQPSSPTPTKPSPNEPYRGPPDIYGGPTSSATGSKRKKAKKGIRERIKDQLLKEAMYFAQNPTELLRILPRGRGIGRGAPRSGGRMPPSYQRGSVSPKGLPRATAPTRPRRARLDPRAGRIGTVRPRASPKPLPATQAPKATRAPAATGARVIESRQSPYGLPPEFSNLPTTAYDMEGEIASDVLRGLPVTPYDTEASPSDAPRPGSGNAPGRAPGQGTNRPGAVRVPAAVRRPATAAAALTRSLPSAALEAVLRAATRRTPRVPGVRSEAPRRFSLPIGDFPLASPTPASLPGPSTGVLEVLKPFPVPRYAYDYDKCNCPKPKKRKPRAPRTICKAGSYTQTAKGIKYSPNREVPCS